MHADLASYLAGAWTVDRTATDRRAGSAHAMTGTARYTPRDDGLVYDETIQWTVNGRTFDAHREYTLVPTEPWRAEVYFADGRLFHALDLRTSHAAVAHACPPDHYAGWYALDDRDTHRTGWIVTGPRKDVTITTRYTRSAARHRW